MTTLQNIPQEQAGAFLESLGFDHLVGGMTSTHSVRTCDAAVKDGMQMNGFVHENTFSQNVRGVGKVTTLTFHNHAVNQSISVHYKGVVGGMAEWVEIHNICCLADFPQNAALKIIRCGVNRVRIEVFESE